MEGFKVVNLNKKDLLRQKRLRILFRTAGGRAPQKELGLGHVYRCINLSECLAKADKFFLVENYGGIENILAKRRIKNVKFLNTEIDIKSDIAQTVQYIKEKQIDVVIVDKYKIGLRYLQGIKKYARIVFISDLYKIDFPVDLVVNGFIGFNNKISKNHYSTKCLLGPKFQILNKKFGSHKSAKNKIYDLLVTFGGYDEKNLAEIFISQLLKSDRKFKTKIILGPATKKSKQLKNLSKKYGKFLTLINKTDDMQKEISKSKFGFCSGGLTTYEFASQGIPFVIICQVKHQLHIANKWKQLGIALNLGISNQNTGKKIKQVLHHIINDDIHLRHNKLLVDGQGAVRVASEIFMFKKKERAIIPN